MCNAKAVLRGILHGLAWFASCVVLGGGADEPASLWHKVAVKTTT
jgi:hypothetical protein